MDSDTKSASLNPVLTPEATPPKGSSETPHNPLERRSQLDWLWKFLTIFSLTTSLALAVNLLPRFWAGGPSTEGSLVIFFQSIWIFFVIWLSFTPKGRRAGEHFLNDLPIPESLLSEVVCLISMVFLILLVFLYSHFPELADYYYNSGLENYQAGQLSNAATKFKMAIAFNPEHGGARYGMAKLYENQNNGIAARQEYQYAVQGGYIKAFAPLARLYILDKKPDLAVQLLMQGLHQIKDEKNDELPNLHTKLGWARLEQKRYYEAKANLEDALRLTQSLKESNVQAAPHCLLAQVLEQIEAQNSKRTLTEWERCIAYGSFANPDEDKWLGLAESRLKARQERE